MVNEVLIFLAQLILIFGVLAAFEWVTSLGGQGRKHDKLLLMLRRARADGEYLDELISELEAKRK